MPDLGPAELVLLAAAGLAAGAVNSVAGGGSLVSFPALLTVGYPPLVANVTNTVAVLPGYVGGSVAYRRELSGQRARAGALALTAAAGSAAGAGLLLLSPAQLFERLAPFLLLAACGLLAAQPALSRRLGRPRTDRPFALHGLTLLAALYGGYFNAGFGLVLLAVLALSVDEGLQRLNALKGVLSLVIGAVSAACLALLGPVVWLAAGAVAAGALVGGRVGVALARRLSARALRAGVIAFGVAAAAWLLLGG